MKELKTDLFPANLYAAKDAEKQAADDERLNPTKAAEPLPESERPRKDGPGGE